MKRKKFNLDKHLHALVQSIQIKALLYFECNKELLKEKNYYCTYRILRDAFIKNYIISDDDDILEVLYYAEISRIMRKSTPEKIKDYREDVEVFADIVRRNNIADRYNKIKLQNMHQ